MTMQFHSTLIYSGRHLDMPEHLNTGESGKKMQNNKNYYLSLQFPPKRVSPKQDISSNGVGAWRPAL